VLKESLADETAAHIRFGEIVGCIEVGEFTASRSILRRRVRQ
jgi:hypothetical protein